MMKAGQLLIRIRNYMLVLNMLACYDSDLHSHLESSTVFRGSSHDIQNELLHSSESVSSNTIELNK
jgi:hypothetical protein